MPAPPPSLDPPTSLRVLLVDDDAGVRRSLMRLLEYKFPGLEVATMPDAASALGWLSAQTCDVVIADIDMPGMNGTELLGRVQQEYPSVVRVHLSGERALRLVMRAMPVAHRFLPKPVKLDQVTSAIASIRAMRRVLRDTHLRAVVGEREELPAVPTTFVELNEVLSSPCSTHADVAAVVQRDAASAAAVMKVASSPLFAPRAGVRSVETAVRVLGLAHVRAIVLEAGLVTAFRVPGARARAWIQTRQAHANAVVSAVTAIAPPEDRELAVLAAHLHDLGQLILMSRRPARYQGMLDASVERPLPEVEREELGVTHAEVGGYLLGLWGLPDPVIWAVLRHHEAGPAQSRVEDLLRRAQEIAERTGPLSQPPTE